MAFEYCKDNPNRISVEYKTVTCNWCGCISSPSIISQHHNNYCELNPNKLDKIKKSKYRTVESSGPYCGKSGKQPKMMKIHIESCKVKENIQWLL